MKVKVRNGNVEAALRVFKKKSSEKLFELKNRRYYQKPSETKRLALLAATAREQKRRRKNEN